MPCAWSLWCALHTSELGRGRLRHWPPTPLAQTRARHFVPSKTGLSGVNSPATQAAICPATCGPTRCRFGGPAATTAASSAGMSSRARSGGASSWGSGRPSGRGSGRASIMARGRRVFLRPRLSGHCRHTRFAAFASASASQRLRSDTVHLPSSRSTHRTILATKLIALGLGPSPWSTSPSCGERLPPPLLGQETTLAEEEPVRVAKQNLVDGQTDRLLCPAQLCGRAQTQCPRKPIYSA